MRVIISSLLILLVSAIPLMASVFPLKEEVIGVPNLKTECATSSSQNNDFCKTQIAYQLTLYTGSNFGQLSFAMWQGTDEYSSPEGGCGVKFSGKNIRGKKGYIPNSDIKRINALLLENSLDRKPDCSFHFIRIDCEPAVLYAYDKGSNSKVACVQWNG